MMRTLIVWLILTASSFAGQIVVSGQTTISTHSASLWDTVTISGTKVMSATGYTITVNVGYLYFKLDDDTIAFGTGNDSLARGMYITANNIVIDGGYFIHSPTGTLADDAAMPVWPTDTTVKDCAAIRIADQTGIEIKNIRRAVVKGWGSDGQSGGVIRGGNQFWVHDCDSLTNLYYAFARRDYFEATVIRSSSGSSYIPTGVLMHDGTTWGAYNFRISNCEIISKCHVGMYFANYPSSDTTLAARPICIIDTNTITNDARNTRYTSYPAGTYAGTTQNYAIQITAAGPGTKIRGNTIRSGDTYLGGQGIHLVGLRGSPSDPVEVAYNDIDVHSAGNTEYGVGFLSVAVKWRQNCHDLWMHHNRIVYTIDTATIVPDYGHPYSPYGHAVEEQTEWGGGDLPPRNILFENNACSLKVRASGNYAGATLAGTALNFAEGFLDDVSQVNRYNNFYSEGSAVIGNGQTGSDEGASYRRLYRDTLSRKVMNFSCQYTFELGVRGGSGIGMKATDLYYGANTLPTDVSWTYRCGVGGAYQGDLTTRRTLALYVNGTNNRPVSGATVNVYNAYGGGTLVASGVTDANGAYSPTVSYYFDSRYLADSTAFNPFTISVSKSGQSASANLTVAWNAYTDTIDLNVLGDGMWAGANDVVEYQVQTADGGGTSWSQQFHIAGPKHQVAYTTNTTRGLILFKNTSSYSGTFDELTRFVDGVPTDSFSLMAVNPDYVNNENSMAMSDNDTLVIVVNASATFLTSHPILRFNANTTPITYIGATTVTLPDRSLGVPMYLGNRTFIIEFRPSSAASSYLGYPAYSLSTDNGMTWSAPVRILSGWPYETRSTVERWDTGKAVVFSIRQNSNQLQAWSWDGSAWANIMPSTITLTAGGRTVYPHREYGAVVLNDTAHWLLADTGAGVLSSRMVHAYSAIGSGTWTANVVYDAGSHIGGSTEQDRLASHGAVAMSSNVMRWAYGKPESNGTDQMLVSRKYLGGGSWADEVILAQDPIDSIGFLTSSPPTPTNAGDRVTFAFRSSRNDASLGSVYYMVNILGSGAVTVEATGACCLPSGACLDVTSATCAAQGGTYQGDGTSCATVTCTVPTVTTAAEAITGAVTITGNVRIE